MARPIVRAAMGTVLAKRVLVASATIPDVTATDFDNPLTIPLLECTETMNEETVSDGTNVADAPLYSRIQSIRLEGLVHASTASVMRWMLYKSPDADISAATAMSDFHSSRDAPDAKVLRANTLAKGVLFMGASNQGTKFRTFVSRSALRRAGSLRENDVLRFIIAKDAAGTTIPLDMLGTIWVKANG